MAEASRPSRARGLKPMRAILRHMRLEVAPLAGAWIETDQISDSLIGPVSRAPRGRVD